MSKQHHPSHVFAFAILFLLVLLAIGTGPIGFIALVIVGIPIGILIGFEAMAHNKSSLR